MNHDPLPLPDPKLLQLLDVLYDTRSVTRATERLGLSQPTVSIWLAKLREQLRDALFIRTPVGMQPTPQADALIAPARQALESLRRLAAWELGFVAASAQRRFRICMTDASHITLLPQLLAHVRASAPGVRLEAARMDSKTDGQTAQALASGQADLAPGYAPWLESGLYQQTLFAQDWVCLAHAARPRIARLLTLQAYRDEGHIAVGAGTGSPLLEAALARAGVQRQVVLELPSFLGLGAIVGSSDLIVTLPRQIGETLARQGGLAVYDCPLPVQGFEVRQHWHARYHQDAANQWLRGLVAGLFGGRRRASA